MKERLPVVNKVFLLCLSPFCKHDHLKLSDLILSYSDKKELITYEYKNEENIKPHFNPFFPKL